MATKIVVTCTISGKMQFDQGMGWYVWATRRRFEQSIKHETVSVL